VEVINMSSHVRSKNIRLLGHSDLNAQGDAMQVMIKDNTLYVGRMVAGRPMLILDVSDSRDPRVVGELPSYPGTWHTKCQVHGDYMIVNYEQRDKPHPAGRTGFSVFDVSRPAEPREITYVNTGGRGVHRIWWAGERHCYVFGRPDGFRDKMLEIYDLNDLSRPILVGRWWTPGLWAGGGEAPPEPARNGPSLSIHHGIYCNGRLYCGHWDAGLLILDVSHPEKPTVVSTLEWPEMRGCQTHTAHPLSGRNLLVVLDEATEGSNPTYMHLVDIVDERNPRELSRWRPEEELYAGRGGRYGPHNLHEHRPGTYVSDRIVFVAAFNAGLQVVDIADAENPVVIGYYVPSVPASQVVCSTNDVVVAEDGRIFTTDRISGGLHVLEME
jgi:hypothetical protein